MKFATIGVIAPVPGDVDPFGFSTFMADDPFTIISEDKTAFFARGTKENTAFR